MKIAVCDDNEKERSQLSELLEVVWPDAQVFLFGDGEEILSQIRTGKSYDLVFLDIFMEKVGGIEAGKQIRELYPETEVVLVSVSREFGPEAFELNAFYYLVKPYEEELLRKVKERFQTKMVPKVTIYDVGSRQEQKIPFQKITYIESMHNYLYIHTVAGAAVKVRESLQMFLTHLDDRFLRINRGVIVNMEAVERMNTDSCEVDGMVFMLSRRQRAEKRRKYNDYIFKHYMEE